MISSLEGIRGIASILVALYHLKIGSDYFSVIRNGYLFVDLFFVLSGFIMCATYSSSLRTVDDVRVFLIRRIGRLFPLLVFSTIVFILLSNAIVLAKKVAIAAGLASMLNNPGTLDYLIPSAGEILSTLTFTHALGIFDHLILNTPSWSISVEFYAYVLFAAVCLFSRGKSRIALFAALVIAGLLISTWASVNMHNCVDEKGCLSLTYDFGFVRCVHAFFLGGLAYYSSRLLTFNATSVQLSAMFALFMLFTLVDYVSVAAFAFPLVFAVLVLAISSDTGPVADAMKPKLFQRLGQCSYSIYLLHMPLMLIFENLTKRATGFLASVAILVAYVVVLFIVSGWTYRYIENPLRARFNRYATRSEVSGAGTRI